jgi:hypothetical protein
MDMTNDVHITSIKGGHINRKPMYRTDLTCTEAELTETEIFGSEIG